MEYTLIHFSDLHFKNDTENRYRLEKLCEDIATIPLGTNIITAFTGDLVQSGEQEQYEVLWDLLICPLIEAKHQIVLVPGNHDIQRDRTSADAAQKVLKDKASSYLFSGSQFVGWPEADGLKGPLENYFHFETLFDPFIDRSHYGFVKQFGDLSIIGMNSTWLSHFRDGGGSDRGNLRVEPYVLQKYAESLPSNNFKVLMLHHPFDWLEESTRDAVTSLSMKHFDLVLFGHVHTADTTTLIRNESGATFIQSPPLRADWSKGTNGYSIIRCNVAARAVEITYRSYSKSRRLFVPGEDFGDKGVSYPRKEDRDHYKNAPSLSALAQRFLAAAPHDFVDWHRKNIRAKSMYIESFIVPNVLRATDSEEGTWLEPPIPLTKILDASTKDRFVIAPADSGLTTSAFLAVKALAESVATGGEIPVFFDAGASSINRAAILRSMVQCCIVSYTFSEMEHLALEGSVRLICDGLDLSNADRFNTFRETMRKHFPKVRVIAFVCTEKVGRSVSSLVFPTLSVMEDEIFELGELGVEQIREFIAMHRKKVDVVIANRLANLAIESLSQMNEPVFPSTVAVLIETLLQDTEFRPLNKVKLLDRYVECLLGRFELEDVREGTFSSFDKIKLLSFIARRILESDAAGLSQEQWKRHLSNYETDFMIELPKGLLEEFEEKGLLISENGQITFRADYLFSYFVAQQMKSDQDFARQIVSGDGIFRHYSEVIYYGELEGTNTAEVLNQLYAQVDLLEERLLEQYSREGIDLTAEWRESSKDSFEEMIAVIEEFETACKANPDPSVADLRDNQRLEGVLRRRGIARREDVLEIEARLLVALRLYGHLLRNALHIAGSEKLKHIGKLYDAAEIWVGFMSALRVEIASSPMTIAGGVCFINRRAAIDRGRSIADFKYDAPNSISRILADSVRNPLLSVALRTALPSLSPMGALFAREALLNLPGSENRRAYLDSIGSAQDQTLVHASLRSLKRQYLGSGRNTELLDHATQLVVGIRKVVGERSLGDPSRLEKQRLIRDLRRKSSNDVDGS